MKELSSQLKDLREKYHLSQEELAEQLNVTRQAISNYERAKTVPDIYTLQKIAEIYDISIDQLLSLEDRKRPYLIYSTILYVIMLIMFIGFCVYSKEFKTCILPGVIITICSIVYFAFGYAVRNDDYTMIAGYNSSYQYHYPTLRKMISLILFTVVLMSSLFIFMIILLKLVNGNDYVIKFLFIVYILQFILTIVMIGHKYNGKILIKVDEKQKTKDNKAILLFIVAFVIAIVTFIGCFEYYGVTNNSPEAIKMITIFLPNVIIFASIIVLESTRKRDKISKWCYYALGISLCLDVVLFFVCKYWL